MKVYTTLQQENYAMPWQAGEPMLSTGTGFIIAGRRILTNAHLVSNARFIEVQKDGDPRRYRARVAAAGHDCDLALLTVDEPGFHEGTRPMTLAERVPSLDAEVVVLGYPQGGNRLSLTRGVVSRVDYHLYAHSGVDEHLVLQVDAAINPGNSGGPVLFRGEVVGLAFQGLAWAENIGFAIPSPVIRRFLADLRDGAYDGYPELGVSFLEMRNPALRRDLGLPEGRTGVVVHRVDPFGSARGLVLPRDVLAAINGSPIADDGSIQLNGETVFFAELLERRQTGDSVLLDVWRDGLTLSVAVPLRGPADPFVFRNLYDERPRYLTVGGLVFSPLSRNYLRTLDTGRRDAAALQLQYFFHCAKTDGLYEGRDEFVVLIHRLPHPANRYADGFLSGVVTEVNGIQVRSLRDVKRALAAPRSGFHVFAFAGMPDRLVLDAAAAAAAEPDILARYSVPAAEWLGGGP